MKPIFAFFSAFTSFDLHMCVQYDSDVIRIFPRVRKKPEELIYVGVREHKQVTNADVDELDSSIDW